MTRERDLFRFAVGLTVRHAESLGIPVRRPRGIPMRLAEADEARYFDAKGRPICPLCRKRRVWATGQSCDDCREVYD